MSAVLAADKTLVRWLVSASLDPPSVEALECAAVDW